MDGPLQAARVIGNPVWHPAQRPRAIRNTFQKETGRRVVVHPWILVGKIKRAFKTFSSLERPGSPPPELLN